MHEDPAIMAVVKALDNLTKAIDYRYLPRSVEITADERLRLIRMFDGEMHFPIEPGPDESVFGLAAVVCEAPTLPDLPEARAFHEALAKVST